MVNIETIFFYTLGKHYDNAKYFSDKVLKIKKKFEKLDIKITFYNTSICQSLDNSFNKEILTSHPEYNYDIHASGYSHGFWRWKPYIINYHLKSIKDNNILVYQDIDIDKYPGMFSDMNNYINNIMYLLDKINSDIILQNLKAVHLKNKIFCKKNIFTSLNVDNDFCKEQIHLAANLIIIRKTDLSKKFIEEWLYFCKLDKLIFPENKNEEISEFRFNTWDQAILNVLFCKYVENNYFYKPFQLCKTHTEFSFKNFLI